jgi:exodeoxyribonuclease VIII
VTEPGIYYGVPDHEYRAWDALGSTDIKTLATQPAGVFQYRRQNPRNSAAFDVGRVAHSLILEGDESRVVAIDVEAKRGKAWTEPAEAARAEGKTPLTVAEWAEVKAMRDSVFANPEAAKMLTGHEAETSLRWDYGGTPLKARLDGWHRNAGVIVDLKTTRDASPRGFGRSAAEYGYHAQAAHYSSGVFNLTGQTHEYFIVCVEKAAPFTTAVYEVFPDMIDAGAEIVREGINAYREATAADAWPTSYPMQPLDLPAWAYPEVELNL